MVASAQAGAFDVLVVGYVSRFLRNLKQTLIAVEDHLHAAGVVVLFADERLLSSDPEQLGPVHPRGPRGRGLQPEAVQARRRGLRREATPPGRAGRQPGAVRDHPGGQALGPAGRRGEGGRSSARPTSSPRPGRPTGRSRPHTGLAKTHVGELLTNPIYAGRLRTGEAAGIAPIVDPALWSTVQTMRERRRTRTPGRIVKRAYALRLRCSGCGRFLYGDVGRYRHPAPTCEAFLAGTPEVRRRYARADDKRDRGPLLPAGRGTRTPRRAPGRGRHARRPHHHRGRPPLRRGPAAGRRAQPWRASTASARRHRQRLAKTRDIAAWQATMARLDAEEQAARQPRRDRRLAPDEVVAYLRSLPALWADSGPEGRQALATALFARTDVEGYERMEYELTPDAIELGLNAALPAVFELGVRSVSLVGARGFEPPTSSSRTMRATKLRHAPTEMPV